MASMNSTWFYVVPDYYRVSKKMEGWLKSQAQKLLSADRGIFFSKHSGVGRAAPLAPARIEAAGTAAFHLRHKPMGERIRSGYF